MSPALVAAAHSPESISRVDLLPGGDQPITVLVLYLLLVLGSGANTSSPLSFRAHGCNIFVAFLFYTWSLGNIPQSSAGNTGGR